MLNHAYEPGTWLPYLALGANLVSSLAWPFALGFVVWIFRSEIRKLIARLRRAGFNQLEFGPEQDQPEPPSELLKETKELRASPNVLRSTPLGQAEEAILSDLKDIDPEHHVPQLVTALAVAQNDKLFAIAYANIFGSQIQALRLLSQRGGFIDTMNAVQYFSELRGRIPFPDDWTLDRYLLYLKNFGFIEVDTGGYKLTERGRDFLLFLTRYNLSEDRQN